MAALKITGPDRVRGYPPIQNTVADQALRGGTHALVRALSEQDPHGLRAWADARIGDIIAAEGWVFADPLTWDAAVTYRPRRVVERNGGWYVSTDTTTGDDPELGLPWRGLPTVVDTRIGQGSANHDILAWDAGAQSYIAVPGVVNVALRGAKGDGVTDDHAALQGLADDLYAAGGGTMFFPAGTYLLSQTLDMGTRVRLLGAGTVDTQLRAASAFAINTPLVRLDRPADNTIYAHHNRVRSMTLDCNGAAQIGVYSENVQEQGGLVDVTVINWTHKGVHFVGGKCMHFNLDDVWAYPKAGAVDPAGIGIHLNGCGSVQPIRRATVVGQSNEPLADCILVESSIGMTVEDAHMESAAHGVRVVSSSVTVVGASGHSSLPNVVTIDSGRLRALGVELLGSTTRVLDRTGAAAKALQNDIVEVGGGQFVSTAATSTPSLTVQGASGLTAGGVIHRVQQSDGAVILEVRQGRDVAATGGNVVTESNDVRGIILASADGTVQWRIENRPDLTNGLRIRDAAGTRVIDASQGGGLGFFGVQPVGRQTLPGATTVTAADIRAALIALGFCQ